MSSEVQLELVTLKSPSQQTVSLTATLQTTQIALPLSSPQTLPITCISAQDELTFTLYSNQSPIGTTSIKLTEISAITSLNISQVQFSVKYSLTTKGDCPFLNSLGNASIQDRTKVDSIWDQRKAKKSTVPSSLIRISLDNDPQQRNQPIFQIPTLRDLDIPKLIQIGAPAVKKMIKTLAGKVIGMNENVTKLPYLLTQLRMKIQDRREAQVHCEEATQKLTQNWKKQEQKLVDLLNQKAELSEQLIKENQQSRVLQTEVDKLQAEIANKKRLILQREANQSQLQNFKNTIRILQGCLDQSNYKKEELEKELEIIKQRMEANKKFANQKKQNLESERDQLQSQLQSVQSRRQNVISQNQKLKKQLQDLKSKLSNQMNLKQQIKQTKVASTTQEAKRQQAQQDVLDLSYDIQQQIKHYKQKQKQLISRKKQTTNALPALQTEIEAKQLQIFELRRRLYTAATEQITLQQVCCIRADLSQLIDDLTTLYKIHSSGRDTIMKSIDTGAQFIVTQTEQVLQQARYLDLLIDSIDDKENEIDNIKTTIGDIKRRNPPYIPVKDDPVDLALSEFLNTLDDPMPIPFKRQDEGVYMFGTKRVFIGLENGVVRIRIGGGYSSIEEFIEIYTPLELEQQEEDLRQTNPQGYQTLKRFWQKPNEGMSPLRASRILLNTADAIAQGSPTKPRSSLMKKKKKQVNELMMQ